MEFLCGSAFFALFTFRGSKGRPVLERQDGYALCEGDGVGEYEVAFEAHAGSERGALEAGRVAYIATGAISGAVVGPPLAVPGRRMC